MNSSSETNRQGQPPSWVSALRGIAFATSSIESKDGTDVLTLFVVKPRPGLSAETAVTTAELESMIVAGDVGSEDVVAKIDLKKMLADDKTSLGTRPLASQLLERVAAQDWKRICDLGFNWFDADGIEILKLYRPTWASMKGLMMHTGALAAVLMFLYNVYRKLFTHTIGLGVWELFASPLWIGFLLVLPSVALPALVGGNAIAKHRFWQLAADAKSEEMFIPGITAVLGTVWLVFWSNVVTEGFTRIPNVW